jgi:hypothetical protein
MGQNIGDGAINKPPVHEHQGNDNTGFHHEIHHTSHKHLLHHAHSAAHHKPDSAKAHIPDLCIDDKSQGSLVADEDQSYSKILARRAVAGVNCKADATAPGPQESLVADEDQNQSKLLSRLAISGQLTNREAVNRRYDQNTSIVADEDQNQDKLLARMALNGQISNRDAITPANNSNAFESLDLNVRPQPRSNMNGNHPH